MCQYDLPLLLRYDSSEMYAVIEEAPPVEPRLVHPLVREGGCDLSQNLTTPTSPDTVSPATQSGSCQARKQVQEP